MLRIRIGACFGLGLVLGLMVACTESPTPSPALSQATAGSSTALSPFALNPISTDVAATVEATRVLIQAAATPTLPSATPTLEIVTLTPLPPTATPSPLLASTPTPEPPATKVSPPLIPTRPPPGPTSTPAPVQAARSARRIWAIGDSVMLGTAGLLQQNIPNIGVNAKVSRYFGEGIVIVNGLRAAGELGDEVIIHLGTNGPISDKQFDDMMATLKGVRRVVFVNLKVPRQWESPNNRVLADGIKRYSNAVLVDWHSASAGQPGFFQPDGYHTRPDGASLYVRLIVAAL